VDRSKLFIQLWRLFFVCSIIVSMMILGQDPSDDPLPSRALRPDEFAVPENPSCGLVPVHRPHPYGHKVESVNEKVLVLALEYGGLEATLLDLHLDGHVDGRVAQRIRQAGQARCELAASSTGSSTRSSRKPPIARSSGSAASASLYHPLLTVLALKAFHSTRFLGDAAPPGLLIAPRVDQPRLQRPTTTAFCLSFYVLQRMTKAQHQ
jgi:hypothetical protein